MLVLLLLVPMFSTAIRVQATTYLWSTFHGDNARTGYSSAAAPTTNNIEWTYTTGDMVFSSPAIAYDKVFIGSYDGNMYALNQNNGGCEWSFNAGEPIVSSPAVADNEVFFCTIGTTSVPSKKVYCLAQSSGTQVWISTIGTGGLVLNFGSPAVDSGKVFLYGGDGLLYCLSETDGHTIWTAGVGNVAGAPSVADGKVFVACDNWLVKAFDENSGNLVWSWYEGKPMEGNTIYGGRVFTCTTEAVLALFENSLSFSWRHTLSGGFWPISSPAGAYSEIFVLAIDGTKERVYELSQSSGSENWHQDLGSYGGSTPYFHSSPVVATNTVYVGSWDHKVYALDEGDGSILWSFSTGDFVISSPAVSDGALFIGSWDHKVYTFKDTLHIPPSLTLSTPQVSDLAVTINGATIPGTPGTTITRIHWDWGDGQSNDQWFPASHTYGVRSDYTVTVTSYQSDGLETSKTTQVQIPDFVVSVSPSSDTIQQGSSKTATITITSTGGYSDTVDLYHSGEPSGVTITFGHSSGYPPFTSPMIIQVAQDTGIGTYPITITGKDRLTPQTSRSTTYTLTVGSVPDFAMSLNPTSLSIDQGSSSQATVSIQQINGYSFDVSLLAINQPTGVSITFDPSHGTASFSSVMSVQVAYTVPADSYPITINGTGSDPLQQSHETTLLLTVNRITFLQDMRLDVGNSNYDTMIFQTPVTFNIYAIQPAGTEQDYEAAVSQHFGISLSGDFQHERIVLFEMYGIGDLADYLGQNWWSSWIFTPELVSYIHTQHDVDGAARLAIVWRDSIQSDWKYWLTHDASAIYDLLKLLSGICDCNDETIKDLLHEISDLIAGFPLELSVHTVFLSSPQQSRTAFTFSTVAISQWMQDLSDFLNRADLIIEILKVGFKICEILWHVDPVNLAVWIFKEAVSITDCLITLFGHDIVPASWADAIHLFSTALDPVELNADTEVLSENGDLLLGWNSTGANFIYYSQSGFMIRDNTTQFGFIRKTAPIFIEEVAHGSSAVSIPYTLCISDDYGNQSYVSSGNLCANQSVGIGISFANNVSEFGNRLTIEANVSGTFHRQGSPVAIDIHVNDTLGPRGDAAVTLLVDNLTWITANNLGLGNYQAVVDTSNLTGLTPILVYAEYPNMTTAYCVLLLNITQDETLVFEDSFESYALGSQPTPPWVFWFNQNGAVVNTTSVSPTKSLRLLGASNWGTVAAIPIAISADRIGYEVMITAENWGEQGATGAGAGFARFISGGIWTNWASVVFCSDGNITSSGHVLQAYNLNTWYDIVTIFTLSTGKYSVWIDGQFKGEYVDTNSRDPHEIQAFSVSSDHAQQVCYFDNVKVLSFRISDVAVENVTLSKNVVGQGFPLRVNVTVANHGDFSEALNVSVRSTYSNQTLCSETPSEWGYSGSIINPEYAVDGNWQTCATGNGYIFENFTVPAFTISASWTFKFDVIECETSFWYWNYSSDDWANLCIVSCVGPFQIMIPSDGLASEKLQLKTFLKTQTGLGIQFFSNYYGGNVTWILNATSSIARVENITLPEGQSMTIAISCNLESLNIGNHTISAWAELAVDEEEITNNNNLTGGWVIVSIPGDITGSEGWPDGEVDMRDIGYVARRFLCTPGSDLWDPNADINDDLITDMWDVGIAARNFLAQYP